MEACLGLKILLLGDGPLAFILMQLLEISGAKVFHISKHDKKYPFKSENITILSALKKGMVLDKIIIIQDLKYSIELIKRSNLKVIDKNIFILTPNMDEIDIRDFTHRGYNLLNEDYLDTGLKDPLYRTGYSYPPGHVRWTFKGNMQYCLDLMNEGRLLLDSECITEKNVVNFDELEELVKNQDEKKIHVYIKE